MADSKDAGLKTLVAMLAILIGVSSAVIIFWQARPDILGERPGSPADVVEALKGLPLEHDAAQKFVMALLIWGGVGALLGGVLGVGVIYFQPSLMARAARSGASVAMAGVATISAQQQARAEERAKVLATISAQQQAQAEEREKLREAQLEAADPLFHDLRSRVASGEITMEEFGRRREVLRSTRPVVSPVSPVQLVEDSALPQVKKPWGGLALFSLVMLSYLMLWAVFFALFAAISGPFAAVGVGFLGLMGLAPAFFVALLVGLVRASTLRR